MVNGELVPLPSFAKEMATPVGAVTVMFEVRLVPLAVKDWKAEGTLSGVLKLERAEGAPDTEGGGLLTSPLNRTLLLTAPLTSERMLFT